MPRCKNVVWFAIFGGSICGCASPPTARYVYQDAEFGVIGIPTNTPLDKTNYTAQAEILMSRHFPQGYEIVRAEEVVAGQRTLEFSKKSEVDAEPTLWATGESIRLAKLGRSTSYVAKDQLQFSECRIVYRRKTSSSSGQSGRFATVSTLSPALYVDPNDTIRQRPSSPALADASLIRARAADARVENATQSRP